MQNHHLWDVGVLLRAKGTKTFNLKDNHEEFHMLKVGNEAL